MVNFVFINSGSQGSWAQARSCNKSQLHKAALGRLCCFNSGSEQFNTTILLTFLAFPAFLARGKRLTRLTFYFWIWASDMGVLEKCQGIPREPRIPRFKLPSCHGCWWDCPPGFFGEWGSGGSWGFGVLGVWGFGGLGVWGFVGFVGVGGVGGVGELGGGGGGRNNHGLVGPTLGEGGVRREANREAIFTKGPSLGSGIWCARGGGTLIHGIGPFRTTAICRSGWVAHALVACLHPKRGKAQELLAPLLLSLV